MKRVQILSRTASTKPRSIEVENLDLNWDTRLHMAVLQVLDEWKAFRSSFRRPESTPNPPSDTRSAPNTWNVWFKGQSTICAALSSRHSMELKAPESLKLAITGGQFELSVPQCAFLFDGNSILEAHGLVWTLADQSNDQIAQERATFDYLVSFSVDFLVNLGVKLANSGFV
jgi:pyrroloquinoline quinone (PQQ) biosynthesis protein C